MRSTAPRSTRRRSARTRSSRPIPGRPAVGEADRGSAQGGLLARRGGRMRRHRRSGRLGRADLRQARRRPGERDDGHQRGQGRGDRRGLRRGRLARRGERRRHAPGADGSPEFAANHAGGIAGGISTGQPVVVRVAFKPTSSILIPQDTVTREGEATELATKGRHDPVRRHARHPGGRGDDGAGAGRPQAAAPGAVRVTISRRTDAISSSCG
jgi:hypothetical protein